jgi:hypothetical protein
LAASGGGDGLMKLRLKPTRSAFERIFVNRSAAKPGLHGKFDTFVHIQAVQARLEARLPVGVGNVPLGTHKAALFQPHQSGIQRSHIDAKRTGGDLFQASGDGVAVEGSKRGKRLQQHQVECALENFSSRGLFICHANGATRVPLDGQMTKAVLVRAAHAAGEVVRVRATRQRCDSLMLNSVWR